MRRFVLLFLLVVSTAILCHAGKPSVLAGRWEGDVQIPGSGMRVVIDLDQKDGAWIGSATVPGYGVQGSPLSNIIVTGDDVEFSFKRALGSPKFKAKLQGDSLKGKFTMGENAAPFVLARAGTAQVELPKSSTPVSAALKGEWRGDLPFVGQKLDVVLKLTGVDPKKPGEFIVATWGNKAFPLDLWTEDGNRVTFVSDEPGISFEGELKQDSPEIAGTFRLSVIEQPLTLRRSTAN